MGSKRNKSNHKYFILFICAQVVIANYILQHNSYQKVEIMNITLHTHTCP